MEELYSIETIRETMIFNNRVHPMWQLTRQVPYTDYLVLQHRITSDANSLQKEEI